MPEYRYFDGDTKHPYEYKECEACHEPGWIQKRRRFCSRKCSKGGSQNPGWKGSDAGYVALHGRVYRELGTASSCPWECSGPYEWAHRVGEKGSSDEYVSMCASCHRKFDCSIAKCFPKMCGKGLHDLASNKDFYSSMRNGKEVRQCKQCAKDRAAAKRATRPT